MPLTSRLLEELSQARQSRYREAEDQLKTHLINLVRPLRFIPENEMGHRVGVRLKPESTIAEKVDRMRRHWVTSLDQLEHRVVTDIVGGRVVLDYLYQVRQFCERVRQCSHWRVVKDNRGRVNPHTGYRSRHLDVILFATTSHKDIRCEIQVRSSLQHTFASWSHPVYELYRQNPKTIPDFLRGRLRQVSDHLSSIDKQADRLYNEIRRVMP